MSLLEFAGDSASLAQDAAQFDSWASRAEDAPSADRPETDVLASLFLYLADGYQAGSLMPRAAALLLFFRSDLVPASSYKQVADQLGVSTCTLTKAMRQLRGAIPAQSGRLSGLAFQSGLSAAAQTRAQLGRGFIGAKELGRLLGVNWQTINRKARAGRFPAPVKLGRHQFYSIAKVEAFLGLGL